VRIPARGGDRGLILKGLFIMFLSNFKEKTELLKFIFAHFAHIAFCIVHFCIFCRLGIHALMTFRRVRIPARGGDRGLILKGVLCFFTMLLPKFKEKIELF
jgi:hypothetical protein